MTLLHWSLKYMFYSHDLLPQLDFLYRQTATQTSWTLCEVPGWQVTPCQVLQALHPARLCLWRTLSSRCSAMLACCSHQDFPAEPPHQKLAGPVSLSPFGNPSLTVTCVCTWSGEMSDPGLDGGYSSHKPSPWAARVQLETWRRKITSAIPFTALHHK